MCVSACVCLYVVCVCVCALTCLRADAAAELATQKSLPGSLWGQEGPGLSGHTSQPLKADGGDARGPQSPLGMEVAGRGCAGKGRGPCRGCHACRLWMRNTNWVAEAQQNLFPVCHHRVEGGSGDFGCEQFPV